MTTNKYIGSRYVPLYIGVHDENKSYEPLSIVSNEAKTKTYTSKQTVPVGVPIDNEDYWAQSGYFQDGIVDIHPDIYEVASYDQPTFTVTKGEEEAELKLGVADSYSAGGSFGEAYVLNTLTQAGLYIIKPSACVEVPEAIAEVETPVSLSVILYNVDSNPCYMQQIVSDNAIYVRHCDSETVWGDWQGVISSEWEDITDQIGTPTYGTLIKCYKNENAKLCYVQFKTASGNIDSTGLVQLSNALFRCSNFPKAVNKTYESKQHIKTNEAVFYYETSVSVGTDSSSISVPSLVYCAISGSYSEYECNIIYPIA